MSVRIAEQWFEIHKRDFGVTQLVEPYVDPLIRCNVWHVGGRDRDLMIDTGLGVASLREAAREQLGKPVTALATHTHYDHTGGMHEFEERLVHKSEAELLAHPSPEPAWLLASDFPPQVRTWLADSGYALEREELLTAHPYRGFDPKRFKTLPAAPTRLVDEGDVIDLGDRSFEVLHLPGHTPGSIGLWEAATGLLFSGDAIYDGPLLDGLPESDIDDYVGTMKRLRELPVSTVHGGHEPSFGRERLHELVDAYLERREKEVPQ